MGRRVDTGIIWRPAEILLLVIAGLLALSLVWVIRETNHQNSQSVDIKPAEQVEDGITQIVERDMMMEQQIDNNYSSWEYSSISGVDGAADDIGSVYDESAY